MTRLPKIMACYYLLLGLLSFSAHASLTNLVIGNADFEDDTNFPPGQYNQAAYEAIYGQWDTAGNGFEILAEGSDGAPSTFSDGSSTGQSLEIRGQGNNGQITLVVSVPNDPNILPGADAQLRFQAWSQDNGGVSYANTGTVRIRVNGANQTSPAAATVSTPSTSAWTLNTFAFNVDAGDTINIQWRDSGPGGQNFGLRIDNVQLLVDIIPEPSHVATLILGGLMLLSYWRRRIPAYPNMPS